MSLSLYDASVKSYQQILGAMANCLEKGRMHFEANGADPNAIVQSKLVEDMFPFHFQVVSTAHHSLGALQGIEAGVFGPPGPAEYDYAGLQALIKQALDGVNAYSAERVNALAGNDMLFKMGNFELPFTVEGFILSFSLPNFYFHASTTYDFLRMNGVPVGKADFLGAMQLRG